MQRAILTSKARAKIQIRYNSKFEEFSKLSPEELKELFNTKKLSATDRQALVDATGFLLHKRDVQPLETIGDEVIDTKIVEDGK